MLKNVTDSSENDITLYIRLNAHHKKISFSCQELNGFYFEFKCQIC